MDDETIPWSERALTFRELCTVEHVSPDTMTKLEKEGYGPDWTYFPGTAVKRCSPAARVAWHARLNEWKAANAKEIEAQRKAKIERMSVLGKLSTKSPRHPSHRKSKKAKVR